jgi:hypothetical protein
VSTRARIFRSGAQASLSIAITALAVAFGAGSAHAAMPHAATPQTASGGDSVNNATIQGFAWKDTNRDGLRATKVPDPNGAEPPVPGVHLWLFPPGTTTSKLPEIIDKIADLPTAQAKAVIASEAPQAIDAWTGGNGKYGFVALPQGTMHLIALPNLRGQNAPISEQFRLSAPHRGTDAALDSDFTEKVATKKNGKARYFYGEITEITVGKGTKINLDLGVTDPETAPDPDPDPQPGPKNNGEVCVQAWNDKDKDGLRDTGETPVAGLPVDLVSTSPSVKNQARSRAEDAAPVTDDNGRHCFSKLRPGSYQARLALGPLDSQNGTRSVRKLWELTKKDVGHDDTVDSDFALLQQPNEPEFTGKVGVTDALNVKDDQTLTVDGGVYKNEPAPSASPTPPAGGGSLPVTGAAVGGILAAGALLLLGGAALATAARRRRRTAV